MKSSFETDSEVIKRAWLNLAADVLLLAIEDIRQTRDLKKREDTKRWLLSKDAGLFFCILDVDLDIREWVEQNCPKMEKQ